MKRTHQYGAFFFSVQKFAPLASAVNCPNNFPTKTFFDVILQKTTWGGITMTDKNIMTKTADRKGYLLLAPTGERLIAAMSVVSWLVFIIKFAVV